MKPEIIQQRGVCQPDVLHDTHVFVAHEYDTHVSLFQCWGLYGCRNCGDVMCMSCVFREWHDECVDDCPDCCEESK